MTLVRKDNNKTKAHKVIKMEAEACMYDKFGFCKFKNTCKKHHYTQICEYFSSCTSIKNCPKRHPKLCRRFAIGEACTFNAECAYYHQNSLTADNEKMNKKLKHLERVVEEMAIKIVQLDMELDEVRKNKQDNVIVKDLGEELDKSKEVNTSKISNDQEQLPSESDAQYKIGKLKCDICSYSCKKQSVLKKHIKSNHEGHKCSFCEKSFKTMSEVLQHKAQKHKEKIKEIDILDNIENGSEDFNEVDQDTSFVYSESMLDKFDV